MDALGVGRGFVEASVVASSAAIAAQLEAGYRASANAELYAFVRASSDWRAQWQASAGVGVRF